MISSQLHSLRLHLLLRCQRLSANRTDLKVGSGHLSPTTNVGRLRKWDYIEAHDSIAVLLYEKEMHAVLMVRQFRPTVYARALRQARKSNLPDPPFIDGNPRRRQAGDFFCDGVGFTYELCAGLVDKDKSLVEIVHEEIMEECGYNVPVTSISEIAQFVSAIGTEGTTQTLFFAEVCFVTAMHVN